VGWAESQEESFHITMKSIAYLLCVFICITRADKSAFSRKSDSSNLRGSLFQSLLKDHPALLEKLNAHPDVAQFLQTHPELAEKVKADPSVLDRFLAARDAKNTGKTVVNESKKDPTTLKDDKKKFNKDSKEKEDKKDVKKDKEKSIKSKTEDLLAKDDTTEQGKEVSTEDAGNAVDNGIAADNELKDDKRKSKKDTTEKEDKKDVKKDKENSIKSKTEDVFVKDDTTDQVSIEDASKAVDNEDAEKAVVNESKQDPTALKDEKKKSKKDSTEKEDKKAAKKDKEHSRKSKTEDLFVKDDTTEQGGAVSTEDTSKEESESRRLNLKDKALDLVKSHPDMASYRATSTSHHSRNSPKVDDLFMMARPVIVAAPKSHQDLVDKVRMHPEIMQRLTIDKMINEKIIH